MRRLFSGGFKLDAPVLVMLAILIGALALRYVDPPGLTRLRDYAFDQFQRWQPRDYAGDLPVRIVDVDEASLRELGQWPWPRTVVARLIDKLVEKGAAVIAFDVVFAEPDRTSIALALRDLPPGPDTEALAKLAANLPDNDRILAASIAKAPIVLGFGLDGQGTEKPPRRFHGVAHNAKERDEKSVREMIGQYLRRNEGVVKTLDVLEASAKGNGSITPEAGSAIVRRVPMLFRVAGQRNEDLFPALAIEAIRVLQGASTYIVRWSGAQGLDALGERTGIVSIRVGEVSVETDAYGQVALYDSGHRKERYVSAVDVLNDKVAAEKLDAHIVFIGTSAIGLQDIRSTPLNGAVPGVEVHAQLAEQIVSNVFLSQPDYGKGADFLYLGFSGLLFIVLLPRLSAGRMTVIAVLFIGAGLAVPWLAFSQERLLFDPIYSPATLALIYVTGSALAFMRAERERAQIRGAFGLYLSPDMVEQVAYNPGLLKLGGQMREITVMFTDVRGFTTISEQFDPPGLARFMNRFLTPMTDLILGNRGTVDKYMGDAIMAFWNAPLANDGHAIRACETALGMQARLRALNVDWKSEAEAEKRKHIPVNIGIGLNTGEASVGNFGSSQRLAYSCLGDAVNLASRLEGQCKTYAVGIIIGDKTRERAAGFATIELDMIMVKGKTEPERMFALVGDATVAQSPAFHALLEKHAAFLALYRSGAFVEALEKIPNLEAAAEAAGWHQGYYAMMRERVDHLIDDSPPDWNGVYVAKEK